MALEAVSFMVHTPPAYPVTLVPETYAQLAEWLRPLAARWDRVAIVTDTHVAPLYANAIEHALLTLGFNAPVWIIEAGETSKNPETLVTLLEACATAELTRHSALIALGGGVVSDLTGLVASLFMRGIDYVTCPTTLLAMVDASVGGKTAVNLTSGKNLMGTFWAPRGVYAAMGTLETLPVLEWQNGWAEMIKTAVIGETRLVPYLDALPRDVATAPASLDSVTLMKMVEAAIDFKRRVVEADEKEKGERAILNFGHTVGHSLEWASDYTMSHGHAVARGMAGVMRAMVHENRFPQADYDHVLSWLTRVGLPTDCPYPIDVLNNGLWHDKKRQGSTITFVLPRRLGAVTLEKRDRAAIYQLLLEGFSHA